MTDLLIIAAWAALAGASIGAIAAIVLVIGFLLSMEIPK